jgi:hypothetical protein
MTFHVDNEWQSRMRDAILQPFYERAYPGQYEFIEHCDPRGGGGVDTIVNGRKVDEKIVRWPRNGDGTPRAKPYNAFALETMSCTVEGLERDGWMKTNVVHYLLYCFSAFHEHSMNCYQIEFKPLQEWFLPRESEWPCWRSKEVNRTECRIVPIIEVRANVPVKHSRLARPAYHDEEERLVAYCHCGESAPFGYGVSLRHGKLGTWYCRRHRPPS